MPLLLEIKASEKPSEEKNEETRQTKSHRVSSNFWVVMKSYFTTTLLMYTLPDLQVTFIM